MNITLEVKNLERIEKKLKGGIKEHIDPIVFRVGNRMETNAKKAIKASVYNSAASRFYVRTGKAQQSIAMRKVGFGVAQVKMGVKYGRYLEEGTGIYHTPDRRTPWFTRQIPGTGGRLIYMKGMKARPFWRPAIKQTRGEVNSVVSQYIRSQRFI